MIFWVIITWAKATGWIRKSFGHHYENTSWPIRNEWCCLGTTWGILLKRDFLGTSLYLGNTNVQFGEYYGNTLGLLQYYLGTTRGGLWDCLGTTWGLHFFLLQLNFTYMKRFSYLVSVKNVTLKPSYKWFPLTTIISHVHSHLNYYIYNIKLKLCPKRVLAVRKWF